MKQTKNNSFLFYCIAFIIILLIILSFYAFSKLGRMNDLVPTGNVDIFDIHIDGTCKDDGTCKPCETPVFGESETTILDEQGNYQNQAKLRIFENPAYELKNIIAPESSNVYQFVVRNGASYNINYTLTMKEENKHHINMKYRLKKNGQYVIGNENEWKSAADLKLSNVSLANASNDVYSLEWKWFSSKNDSEIGKIGADYSLTIQFLANQI